MQQHRQALADIIHSMIKDMTAEVSADANIS